jgi:broad specificity phosphatase PhoE
MNRVVLVRHGSTAWTGIRYCGRSDPPLSPAGQVEAGTVAHRIALIVAVPTTIYSSPLARATATAVAIARRIGSSIVTDDRLRELDFGAADGLTFDELEARFPPLARRIAAGDSEMDWPAGETAADARARAASFVAAMLDRPDDAVVVSHAGMLRLIGRAFGDPSSADAIVAPGHFVVVDRSRQPLGTLQGPGR